MRRRIVDLLVLMVVMLAVNCGKGVTTSDPNNVLDDDQNVDPALMRTVALEWDAVQTYDDNVTAITNLEGYRLYYWTQPIKTGDDFMTVSEAKGHTEIQQVEVLAPLTDVSLELRKDTAYYFRLTAYTHDGDESGFNVEDDGVTDAQVVLLAES